MTKNMQSNRQFSQRDLLKALVIVSALVFAIDVSDAADSESDIGSSSKEEGFTQLSNRLLQNELAIRSSSYYYPSRYNWLSIDCRYDYDCLGDNEFCENEQCTCRQNFQHINGSKDCYACPDEGRQCTDCCSNFHFKCIEGICTRCISDEGFNVCDPKSVIFITASQVALLAALVMGVAALATLLYRICTRPNLFTSRYNGNAGRDNQLRFERMSRGSLSSIQIRVLARLCDRPPKYENQINYGSRMQELQQNNEISMVEFQAVGNQPPPAYEGGRTTINELPPSYTETVRSTSSSETLDPNHRQTGALHLSIIDETDSQSSSNIGYGRANTTDSHNANVDVDKTVHI